MGDPGISLVVQWLGLTFQCRSVDSIPGWGAKVPHASKTKSQYVCVYIYTHTHIYVCILKSNIVTISTLNFF